MARDRTRFFAAWRHPGIVFRVAQIGSRGPEQRSTQYARAGALSRRERRLWQLQARFPTEWTQSGSTDQAASHRAMVLYALATARMQLAEQLCVALHEEMQSPMRS